MAPTFALFLKILLLSFALLFFPFLPFLISFQRAENVSQCQGAGCQHGCKPSADGPICFCKEGSQPNGTDCIGELILAD